MRLVFVQGPTAYGPIFEHVELISICDPSVALREPENMPRMLDPVQFVLIAIAGWMNQRQQQMIEYLREENRVLRKQLGDRRLRFNDDQRRRLAVRAKGLGRKLLTEVATLVTPDTLLARQRKLIAQ